MDTPYLAARPSLWLPQCQPQAMAQVELVAAGRPYHALYAPLARDLAIGTAVSRITGTETLAATPAGVGWDFNLGSGNRAVSVPTVVPPSAGWTIETYILFRSNGAAQYLCGFNATNDGTNTTQDRSVFVSSGNAAVAYLYDGAEKPIAGATLIDRQLYHLAAVATASALTIYVNGVGSTVAVSNSGFSGYSTIFFVAGFGRTPNAYGNSTFQGVSTIYHALLHARPLTAAEVQARAAAPFGWLSAAF